MKFTTLREMLIHFGYTLGGDHPMLTGVRRESYGDYVLHTKRSTTFLSALHSITTLKMGGLMAMNVSGKRDRSIEIFMDIIEKLTKLGVEIAEIGGQKYIVVFRQENRL